MPPTCPTFAGTSRPPRSERRKRTPKSGGAGFRESVTFLPEWRPIPAHVMGRRSVRCAFISAIESSGEGFLLPSNQNARASRLKGILLTCFGLGGYRLSRDPIESRCLETVAHQPQ